MPTHSQFVFGNSLFNYAEGGSQTNLAVWLDMLAESDGDTYAVNGTYGFLRDFAAMDDPASQWGFDGVDSAWADGTGFEDAAFDSVVIVPANFIQADSPDTAYPGDSVSPLDAVQSIIANVGSAQPGAQIFIYEGWADLSAFSAFPPDETALADYHSYNAGGYHDWYVSLVDAVNAADPDAEVQLLPVASVLSELYSTTLSEIPVEDIYVDDAPHGTETTYFLASLVVYQASYGTEPPLPESLPDSVHPAVFENYDEINALIFDELTEAGVLDSAVTPDDPDEPLDEPQEEDPASEEEDGTGQEPQEPSQEDQPDEQPAEDTPPPDDIAQDDEEQAPDEAREPEPGDGPDERPAADPDRIVVDYCEESGTYTYADQLCEDEDGQTAEPNALPATPEGTLGPEDGPVDPAPEIEDNPYEALMLPALGHDDEAAQAYESETPFWTADEGSEDVLI